MNFVRFVPKSGFTRKHADGPRRRFGSLTAVWPSALEPLPLPTVCKAALAYETTKPIKTMASVPQQCPG